MSAFPNLLLRGQPRSSLTPRLCPWAAASLVCLVLLTMGADGTAALWPSRSVSRKSELHAAGDNSVIDQFLREFGPLRDDTARRHALASEVVAAATRNQLDPDLLFALVAVESRFDSTAVSRKGARGLGQVMFPTAQAVAPALVRRPGDLYDVRRNLAVTARYLHTLLIDAGGDLRAALAIYHAGPRGHLPKRAGDRYVGLICTYYASLRVRRRYEDMATTTSETTDEGPRG